MAQRSYADIKNEALAMVVMAHSFDLSTQKIEAGRFLCLSPDWVDRVSFRTVRAMQRNLILGEMNYILRNH